MLAVLLTLTTVVSQYNFNTFPRVYTPAPPNQSFLNKYDLSGVPVIAVNNPPASRGPVECSPTVTGTCHFGCEYCLRNTDVLTCPSNRDWAIGFDDGPSPYSPVLLDYFRDANVKSTFFVVGSEIVRYPDILRREFDEGHQIVIHTWSHRALSSLSNEVIVSELEWCSLAISEVIGVRPKYFRPPFGDLDDRVRAVAAAMGLRAIMWNYDTSDWNIEEQIALQVPQNSTIESGNSTSATSTSTENTSEVPPTPTVVSDAAERASRWQSEDTGVISLQHDLRSVEVSQGQPMSEAILAAGMNVVSVAQCIGDSDPYTDPNDTDVVDVIFTRSIISIPTSGPSAPTSNAEFILGHNLPWLLTIQQFVGFFI